ncbi:BrnT family toxin [Sinirhodobacter populi]|uniref:BrnT family toxin n=1 Tax=Paenirhodobacter populi TaxID=2306993 RepID=A0A443JYF2_9RHOB|nr:BrnT family toxin [Sinirhodobacter populi]RWR25516.1 BrnT family toxin [Sinirhodobacter populi]
MTMRFVWDPVKAESNERKHGVRFEEAALVFFDPLHLTVQDRIEGGEYRWQTIGSVSGAAILLVAHAYVAGGPEPMETIRIISARRATPQERKRYANG